MRDPVTAGETQPEVVLRAVQDGLELDPVTRGRAVLQVREKVQADAEPDEISLYGADPPWI